MENNFKNIVESDIQPPAALKDMVVSEIDFIRDTMQIVSMFLGESFVAVGVLLKESSEVKNIS